jgi:hypothetical protein
VVLSSLMHVLYSCHFLHAGLEILVASIESTQSLDSTVIAKELVSRSYHTFFANLSFDTNHQGILDVLARQVRP